MERPGEHPAVAPVVPRAGGDEHAIEQRGLIPVAQDGGDRTAGRFHQGGKLDPRGDGFLVPGGRLGGGEDGKRHRIRRLAGRRAVTGDCLLPTAYL